MTTTINQLNDNDQLPFPNYSENIRETFKGGSSYSPKDCVTKPKDVIKSPATDDIDTDAVDIKS